MRAAIPIAILLGSLGIPAQSQPIDLTGRYVMEGSMDGPRGQSYKGECNLQRNGTYYRAFCVNGNDRYTGKGLASGETFSLYLGEYLLVYRIAPDRRLAGTWVHIASDATGKETLTPK
jgi:hypothetical protein